MLRHCIGGIGLLALLGSVNPVAAKTLVYCSEASPGSFNPASISSTTTSDTTRPMFNRLVEFERGTTRIVPALAESWDISPDGTQYTFHLRHGVKFHSTRSFQPTHDMNADDVIYSFERQWKKDNPDYPVGGIHESFDSLGMPRILKDIQKVDDFTVRFVLSQPEAPFLANIALIWASIVSKEYADRNRAAGTPDKVWLEPIGTGPFIMVNYTTNAVIRYIANPQYWGGRAAIDNLVFAVTPDADTRWSKTKSGECDVMPFPNLSELGEMRKTPGVTVMEQAGLNIGYLAFNVEKKPFDDKRVRQALSMAIDRKAITDAVFSGAGTVAKSPIPPTMWGYDANIQETPYDPERARKLLAEAGYPNGFTADLWAMPVARPYNPNGRRMAEMMQQDLAKVGVKANIVSYEWGEYLRRSNAGEQQMILLGWTSDNGDPDNILNGLLSCDAVTGGSNKARWCNKDFDALMQEGRTTSDVAKRAVIYQRAQELAHEEAPWLTLNHSVVFMVVRDGVKDYKMDPFGGQYFYGVDINR